jgi:ABC-type sugar transport system ATPase subunit
LTRTSTGAETQSWNQIAKFASHVMRIELRGVLKTYRSVRALDHVSLQIEPGQIVSLLGPNGAGKTTLIRCLAGIAAPDMGELYFDDEEFRHDQRASAPVLGDEAIIQVECSRQATKQSSINSSIMVLHVAGCFSKVQDVTFLTQPIDDKQLNATT